MSSPDPGARLSTPQVCAAAGVTYRELDYWRRVGVIRPAHAEASGSGTQRLWAAEQVRVVRLCKTLRRLGAPTATLAAVAAWVDGLPDLAWGDSWLAVAPDGTIIASPGGPPCVGPVAWIVDLRVCVDGDLRDRLRLVSA